MRKCIPVNHISTCECTVSCHPCCSSISREEVVLLAPVLASSLACGVPLDFVFHPRGIHAMKHYGWNPSPIQQFLIYELFDVQVFQNFGNFSDKYCRNRGKRQPVYVKK